MTGDLTSDPGRHNQTFQRDRARLTNQRLIKEGQNGNAGFGVEQLLQVVDAEEHRYGIKPGGHEANGDGPHDRNGNRPLRVSYFLRHVRGAVETGKGPIGIDQPDDESFSRQSFSLGPLQSARSYRSHSVSTRFY